MTASFRPSEVSGFRPPRRIPIGDWIEARRVLSVGSSAEDGPKKLRRTPFVRPILDAWADPYVREIVVQKSAQIGITDLAVDLVCFAAENDPCPMAVFLADQLTAVKIMQDRLQPALRGCVGPLIDDNRITQGEAYLRNGFNLTVSWASSIAQTASRAYKHLVLDEVCKPGYAATGEEGSALGRLRQRQETFVDGKLLMVSTPTTDVGNITRELATCDVIYDWCCPCPHCGAFQPLTWKQVQWEGGKSATREQIETTARYQCNACAQPWTTTQKNAAVSQGQAMPRGPVPPRAVKVGFQLSRLVSLFPGGRLEKLVADWIACQDDMSDLQNFINSALGEPWKTYIPIEPDKFTGAVCAVPKSTIPESADCIAIGIDMQQTGFWYVARAWCAQTCDSWMIECGRLLDWGDVEELCFRRHWARPDGVLMPAWRTMIDCGGTRQEGMAISRTEEAEVWWSENRTLASGRVFLCKGSSHAMPTAAKHGEVIEKTPSDKKIKGGLMIWLLNTNMLKDRFFRSLEKATHQESRGAYLHEGTPEAYFKHISAENKELDGTYTAIKGRDNHWLDCEMMIQAAVSSEVAGGLNYIRLAMEARDKQKKAQKEAENEAKTGQKEPEKPAKTEQKPSFSASIQRQLGRKQNPRRANPWNRRPGGL